MTWLEEYSSEQMPTMEQMNEYVQNPLWNELHGYLQSTYDTKPKQAFSACSGQPGWNVKYQRGAKSLCTLYPMEGFFITLIVVGVKERGEVELLLPGFTEHVQDLYAHAGSLMGARWLMINVTDEAILEDVKRLIDVRRRVK
ncbi:DUF3788 domain-containing protein [Eubacteriales bacterium OttesenSCG-928-A19]|nr:DUF3788 domain-containing protein [Eubacteriales bacterium OttesenSCG-928-A19]